MQIWNCFHQTNTEIKIPKVGDFSSSNPNCRREGDTKTQFGSGALQNTVTPFSNWIELNRIELNWIELNWTELNWTELNWTELNWTELIRIELNWTEPNWSELNWTEQSWIELN